MSCPDQEKWIQYIDGECAEADCLQYSDHLKNCSQCRDQFEEWNSFDSFARTAFQSIRVDTAKPNSVPHSQFREIPLTLVWSLAAAIVISFSSLTILPSYFESNKRPGGSSTAKSPTPKDSSADRDYSHWSLQWKTQSIPLVSLEDVALAQQNRHEPLSPNAFTQ